MKRWLRAPSPAFVISLIALFAALGGTPFAATRVIAAALKDAKADTKLVKKLVPSLSVKHAETAARATTATHATTADSAANATDASKLGGVPAADYVTPGSTLQAGQTESGVFSATGQVSGGYSAYAIGFNPMLPAAPNAYYLSSGTTSSACPGVGQAASGRLCVYEAGNVGSTFLGFFRITSSTEGGVDPRGTLLFWTLANTQSRVWGTWAVTP